MGRMGRYKSFPEAEPLINLPFCPDNAILVGFSGSFAPYPLSTIAGRHDGDLVCLTRREVNPPNSSMPSARCSVSTTPPCIPSAPLWKWIVRFERFHGMRSRADLFPAERKIASCLTDL